MYVILVYDIGERRVGKMLKLWLRVLTGPKYGVNRVLGSVPM